MTRSVLLTGATGTIGSALVPRLLSDPGCTLTLLVRAPDDAAMQARLEDMWRYWGPEVPQAARARLHMLRGNIAEPRFGLTADQWERTAAESTHVIHCAASVKLNMPLSEALTTALEPTRTVIALARQSRRHGTLQKVELVSTVGVWGRTPGLMPERALPEVHQFHNTYEEAKAQAERLVWSDASDLPVTVHRPSMVVGESISGRVKNFQVFYHLCEFLSGGRTLGCMPRLGQTQLDTVPVDWVADAIVWSSRQPGTAGEIFHLCAGPQQAIPLVRLQQLVRDAWLKSGRQVPALHTIDRRWLERLIPVIGWLTGARTRRALRGLKPVLAYLAEQQGFQNVNTAQAMQAAGLPVPRPIDYLPAVLSHYLEQVRKKAAA